LKLNIADEKMMRVKIPAFIATMMIMVLSGSCSVLYTGNTHRGAEIHIAGSSRGFRESPKVAKARKAQEAKERKQKKEWNKFVEETRRQHFKRQSPEVQERMKRNEDETLLRHKAKAKKMKKESKKRARKFR
jgi:hypothetical protein